MVEKIVHLKLFLFIFLFWFSLNSFAQKTKLDIAKINLTDLKQINTIYDLLSSVQSTCTISKFNFSVSYKGSFITIAQQRGDTSIHTKQVETRDYTKDGFGFTKMNLKGNEWIIMVRSAQPGAKLFVDSIKSSCNSSIKKNYIFLVIE